MKTALFDFDLPQELIATEPLSPRDASRLLTVNGNGISDKMVRDLPELLNPGDLMVFNDTKVIPAQLTGKRGEVVIEMTLLKYLSGDKWETFARPGKRLKIGDSVIIAEDFSARIIHKHENGIIEIAFEGKEWRKSLAAHGKMPLPSYMRREAQLADNDSYQTIYAQNEGAVAAPTAGLHFTHELLARLSAKGIRFGYTTLHVGAGTFLPVKTDDTNDHIMHKEYIDISDRLCGLVNQTHKNKKKVIAVGTTSLRAMESAADDAGMLKPYMGDTGIFITPGYTFKVTDIIMTNFHLPKSTLFMLTSAFVGLDAMQKSYAHAIEQQYRFYSYGDACLLTKRSVNS